MVCVFISTDPFVQVWNILKEKWKLPVEDRSFLLRFLVSVQFNPATQKEYLEHFLKRFFDSLLLLAFNISAFSPPPKPSLMALELNIVALNFYHLKHCFALILNACREETIYNLNVASKNFPNNVFSWIGAMTWPIPLKYQVIIGSHVCNTSRTTHNTTDVHQMELTIAECKSNLMVINEKYYLLQVWINLFRENCSQN